MGLNFVIFSSMCRFVYPDLEVYVLNTEADMQDLTFPHSYDSDSILQISALALQQYSSNGLLHTIGILKELGKALVKSLFLPLLHRSSEAGPHALQEPGLLPDHSKLDPETGSGARAGL